MNRFFVTILAVIFTYVAMMPGFAPAQGSKSGKKVAERVVIPFDFESKFDKGRYGKIMGDMIWMKLRRRGGFIIPEAMLEIRDWCKQRKFHPNPNTDLKTMARVVRDQQAGDIGIWGKIERAAGARTDIYDLWIHIVDFSSGKPKVIYKKKARTKTVSEIPHVYVKAALNALYGKGPVVASKGPDPKSVEERWMKGPNLVIGNFEKGKTHPAGWEKLRKHVSWNYEAGTKIIRFKIPPNVAATTGVLYYSDFFPIDEGAKYRFQCRWRTTGTAVKVFVKCYAELPTKFKTPSGSANERREVYRSQQNLRGSAKTWHVHTEDFTPRHARYTPRWGRIMLYAYYPAGTVDWDDIIVKQIVPAPKKR